jgi:hypothetical protein
MLSVVFHYYLLLFPKIVVTLTPLPASAFCESCGGVIRICLFK